MAMSRRLKSNLLAVGLGLFLSIALYGGLTKYTNLSTNIRGAAGVDTQVITDLTVTVENEQDLVVTAGKSIPDVESVSVLAVYDAENVAWDDQTVNSQYDTTVAQGGAGEATVIVDVGGETLQKGTELLTLQVAGSPYDMVVSDVVATFADGGTESLSITLP